MNLPTLKQTQCLDVTFYFRHREKGEPGGLPPWAVLQVHTVQRRGVRVRWESGPHEMLSVLRVLEGQRGEQPGRCAENVSPGNVVQSRSWRTGSSMHELQTLSWVRHQLRHGAYRYYAWVICWHLSHSKCHICCYCSRYDILSARG